MKKYTSLFFFMFAVQFSYPQFTSFSPTSDISGKDFGSVVAISNHDILISSIADATSPGKVYLFDTTNGIEQVQTFYPDDAQSSDAFGRSFSVDGDFIAIGSPLHETAFENGGAVYIYKRTGGNWSFTQKITSPDGNTNDKFGTTVKIIGNYLFISAPDDEPSGQDINFDRGSVACYKWNGSQWDYSQLLSIVTNFDHWFGWSINNFNDEIWIDSSFGLTIYKLVGSNWVMQSSNVSQQWEIGKSPFCFSGNMKYVLAAYPVVYMSLDSWEYTNGSWVLQDSVEADYWSEASHGQVSTIVKATNDKIFLGSGGYDDFNFPAPRKFPLKYYRNINNELVFQTALYGEGPENTDDYFGSAMAVSGDYLVVGAPKEGNGKAYSLNTNLLTIPTFVRDKIAVYPNPVQDVLNIKADASNIKGVEVYSLTGSLLITAAQNVNQIAVEDLSKGIYLVKVKSSDGAVACFKIIKQ